MIEFQLVGKRGGIVFVDECDAALADVRWFQSISGYAVRKVLGSTVLMHRVILDAPKGMQVDHINGNKLDNRRENLRLCTHLENRRAYRPPSGRSRFRGVYWKGSNQMWCAQIGLPGRRLYLGLYPTEIEAAAAYNRAAAEHFGPFAHPNPLP